MGKKETASIDERKPQARNAGSFRARRGTEIKPHRDPRQESSPAALQTPAI